MAQYIAWEKEYRDPKFISNSNEPQLDFKHFIKWLRKNCNIELDGLKVLDLGSGTGKNSIFLSERGSEVTGLEISKHAIKISEERTKEMGVNVRYINTSIGDLFPFKENSFDLILDVVSSNSLDDKERNIYINEVNRVLKPEGFMFVKALCLDGDKNALNLISKYPGKEKNTYSMPQTNIVERVFTKNEIEELYSNFKILNMERKHSYTSISGKPFKRFFWLLYLQKP